jgi:hypothetical protein
MPATEVCARRARHSNYERIYIRRLRRAVKAVVKSHGSRGLYAPGLSCFRIRCPWARRPRPSAAR